MEDLESYLQQKRQVINEQLDKLVPLNLAIPNSLLQAVRYALLGNGKRLRPLLVLFTCEALNQENKHALIPACCLEMVHTYSLIHDDLPAMDNDDFRRGQQTLHRVFPESHAILAGDFLLTYAFDRLADAPYLRDDQRIVLVSALSKTSGVEGMICGQILDIEAEKKPVMLSHLQEIHAKKTGALITCAIQFGAILGGASKEAFSLFTLFGQKIGLAFQVVDDILDHDSAESDKRNVKSTYVSLLGLEGAVKSSRKLLEQAMAALEKIPAPTRNLELLAQYLVKRKH